MQFTKLQSFLLLSVLFIGLCGAVEENKIVAIVNDEAITQSEFNRAFAPVYLQMQASLDPEDLSQKMAEVRQQLLEQLIDEKLMLQEAQSPRQVEVAKGKIGTPPVIEVSEDEVIAVDALAEIEDDHGPDGVGRGARDALA